MSDTVTVTTEAGTMSGLRHDDLILVRNIPFAAPPVGSRRFEAPRPPVSWDGVRPGHRSGPGAVQLELPGDPWSPYFNPTTQDLDCLTLEVHTPTLGDARLPVMVWIHGGGFIGGVGSAPAHSGATFARDGIVQVAINYRLALDGFVQFDDSVEHGVDNLGLRDQVAALEWVQRNIARFGGDPSKITIAGQSAGAMSVAALLAVPSARGLFRGAIVQSPIFHASRDAGSAVAAGREILDRAGLPPAREDLRDLGIEATQNVAAVTAMAWLGAMSQGASTPAELPFLPVHGTEFLPDPVDVAIASGASADVPILIGSVKNEVVGLIRSVGLLEPDAAPAARRLAALAGADETRLEAYRTTSRPGSPDGVLLDAVLTDTISRLPGIDLLEKHAGRGFLYEFVWESPGATPGLGSEHTFDIPFARDDFEALYESGPIGRTMLGDRPPTELAHALHGAFTSFISTGNPGWSAYTAGTRATMRFDAVSEVVFDLAGPERAIWES